VRHARNSALAVLLSDARVGLRSARRTIEWNFARYATRVGLFASLEFALAEFTSCLARYTLGRCTH
jgi:hypothetical protein